MTKNGSDVGLQDRLIAGGLLYRSIHCACCQHLHVDRLALCISTSKFDAILFPVHDVDAALLWHKELISRLDSRTLRPVNVLGLLDFSNDIENGRPISCSD